MATSPLLRRLGVGSTALLLAALAACSSVNDSEGSSDKKVEGPVKIAMSVGQLDDDFMSTLVDYMKAQVPKRKWKIVKVVSAERSADKQVTDIENLLTLKPDVLVVHPTDGAAVVAAVQMANSQGVPVFTVDTPANGGKVVADSRADNVQAGAASAQILIDRLKNKPCWKSKCKVLELQGRLGSGAGDDRSKGAQSVLKVPQIHLISRPTDWEATKAADEAQNVITANKDIAGVTMASELMLPGVLGALKSAGLDGKVGEKNHVVITGIDGTANALDAIRDGSIDGTVSQPLTAYVDSILDMIQRSVVDGEKFKVGPAEFGGAKGKFVQGPAGLDFQIPADPVTKETVDTKTLWANLGLK